MRALAYRVINFFGRIFVLPLYATVEVIGLEKIPRQGPLILAANHLNDGDPCILCTHFQRRLHWMAKVELFEYPILKQFMDVYAFPVRRQEADLSALRLAQEILRRGEVVAMFPEGTRSGERASLSEALPGAALIALRAGAPILPVGISGSQRMSIPSLFLRPLRRSRVVIRVGEPFFLPKPERLNSKAAQAGIEIIMTKIAALLPEEHRGYYGNTVDEDEKQAKPEA